MALLSSLKEQWGDRKTAGLNRRALSVQYLATTLLQEVYVAGLNRDSSIHELENLDGPDGFIRQKGQKVVCPIDGQTGAAYVHCVQGKDNVGIATQILSYSWSYTIGDIVDTLVDFCKSSGKDPKRTYVWICCFNINQHRVAEQKKSNRSGTVSTDAVDFFTVFGDRVTGTGHLLAMMAPWYNPVYLTRIWCIFEMHTAHQGNCKVSVLMPPREKAAFEQDILGQSDGSSGFQRLMKALSRTRVQKAKASIESDRKSILDIVDKAQGGYGTLNFHVNELLRAWVLDIVLSLSKRRVLSWNGTEESLENARACNKIGLLLNGLGQHEAALEKYRKALQIQLTLRKKDPSLRSSLAPEIATSCNNIGMALYTKGDYDEALTEFRSATKMQEAKLGKKHLETATSYNNIGSALEAKGDYKGALSYYKKALKARETTLGKQHQNTATSYNNVGIVLSNLERHDDALKNHKTALAIRRSVLGKRHPDTASSYNNIGMCLRAKGDLDGAVEMYQKALKVTELVLGKEHTITATSYNNIAMVLHDKKDYAAALVEFKRALEIHEAVLGKDHPDTATSYNNIGIVLKAQGDLDGALIEYRKALKIREAVLGWKHYETASTYSNIGRVLVIKEDYDGALISYRKALTVLKMTKGPEHPETVRAQMNIGFVLNAQDETEAAAVEYGYASETLEKRGHAFEEDGDHKAALVEYRKLLEVKGALVEEDHLDIATCHESIGRTLHYMRKYSMALVHYRKALAIRELCLPEGHLLLARNREKIARALRSESENKALADCGDVAATADEGKNDYPSHCFPGFQDFKKEVRGRERANAFSDYNSRQNESGDHSPSRCLSPHRAC